MTTFEKCREIRSLMVNACAEVMVYDNWESDYAVQVIRQLPNNIKKMEDGELLFGIQPSDLTKDEMLYLGFLPFDDKSQKRLIPLWLYPFLAEKITAESISGEKKTYNRSDMDTDMRCGCLAYGVIPKDAYKPRGEKWNLIRPIKGGGDRP